MNNEPYKTYLNENELPAAWYNMRADMKKKPAPLLNPATRKPVTAEELERENEELRAENEYLKKLSALVQGRKGRQPRKK